MPIRKTSKKSAGVRCRLTASQPKSSTTKSEPSVATTLGRRNRVARLGADASAATVGATLLRRTAESYGNDRVLAPARWLYDAGVGRSGGTGRRAGLKIRFPPGSVGSIPTFGICSIRSARGRTCRRDVRGDARASTRGRCGPPSLAAAGYASRTFAAVRQPAAGGGRNLRPLTPRSPTEPRALLLLRLVAGWVAVRALPLAAGVAVAVPVPGAVPVAARVVVVPVAVAVARPRRVRARAAAARGRRRRRRHGRRDGRFRLRRCHGGRCGRWRRDRGRRARGR